MHTGTVALGNYLAKRPRDPRPSLEGIRTLVALGRPRPLPVTHWISRLLPGSCSLR